MGVQVRGWEKSSSLSFLFRCSHSFVTRFFLGLVLYSILFPYFDCRCCCCSFFFAEKTMFSFQTLLKGTFRLLTCYLQFRPQNSPYFLRKPRTRDSRTNGLEQAGSGGEGGEERWVRLGREAKNTSKNTIETDKDKIKERKQQRKKVTVSKSKSSWKVSTTKSVPADQWQSAKSARRSSSIYIISCRWRNARS